MASILNAPIKLIFLYYDKKSGKDSFLMMFALFSKKYGRNHRLLDTGKILSIYSAAYLPTHH
jgi:hypothetical protein